MTEPETTKVNVRIYGQEYTIASTQTKQRVLQIADHVDEVMRDLVAKGASGSVSVLAMLAAINISEELFAERDAGVSTGREKAQFEKDIAHYQQLWEEAKRTHLQYKEDARALQEQKDTLQERLNARSIEVDTLTRKAEEREQTIARLQSEIDTANARARNATGESADSAMKVAELQEKLKEIEGNYFELQMENIQMKGDLDRYRGGQ